MKNDALARVASEHMKVLVVDDEPEIVQEEVELLSRAGFVCEAAGDARAAIDKIVAQPEIAVAVVDIKMPVMSGLEMARHLRDTLPPERDLALIVATGHAGVAESIAALKLGALDFLTKPFAPEHLVHAVGRAVETVRLRRLERDFTAQLQDRLDRRTDELVRACRVKDTFLSLISHELLTPLTTIVGASDIIAAEHQAAGDKTSQPHNKAISEAAAKLVRIVETILELVDLNAGELVLERSDFDVRDMIGELVEAFQPRVVAASQRLEVDIAANLPRICGDQERIKQAVGNLIENAIAFSSPGGEIRLSVEPAGDGIALSVADRGKGMSAEQRAAAFKPFWQADGGADKEVYGLGLGLTLARLFTELHGGEIALTSARGEGTTVTMTLPANGAGA